MSDELPYMPVYVRDALAEAADFDAAERGVAWSLEYALWLERGSLPFDPKRLARLAQVPAEQWEIVWPAISRRFRVEDGWLRHPRVTAALAVAQAQRERRKHVSAQGVAARKRKRKRTDGSTNGGTDGSTNGHAQPAPPDDRQLNPPSPSPSPSGSAAPASAPSPSPRRPAASARRARPGEYSPEFLAFWDVYPRREAKGAAWTAWQKEKPPLEAMLKALAWQTGLARWREKGGEFIPHPATYINSRRWEDEQPATPSRAARTDLEIRNATVAAAIARAGGE